MKNSTGRCYMNGTHEKKGIVWFHRSVSDVKGQRKLPTLYCIDYEKKHIHIFLEVPFSGFVDRSTVKLMNRKLSQNFASNDRHEFFKHPFEEQPPSYFQNVVIERILDIVEKSFFYLHLVQKCSPHVFTSLLRVFDKSTIQAINESFQEASFQ